MFVRFRQTETRLRVSVSDTRRSNGKVRHEHVASLGSIELPMTVAGRIAFWQRLHERLAKLGNRLDPAKVMGEVHARIPMAMTDEQRVLQLANAEADEAFWTSLHDMHAGTVEEHKQVIATAQRAVANGEAAMANAADNVAKAKERVERIKAGEDMPGGLGNGTLRPGVCSCGRHRASGRRTMVISIWPHR